MVGDMGFREAKRRVLEALRSGAYQSESRDDIETKNALHTGEITEVALRRIIEACSGEDHSVSPHHTVRHTEVHVLRKVGWYVKFYFLETADPGTIFISVHR